MTTFIHQIPAPPGNGPLTAVKDNIDVSGMPTTAGCPEFAYTPARDAACVARLRDWGARIIGKTNLDQFATGLVGTRSPYGVPVNPFDPTLIPGGSSSGSAVAVATGACRIALGTDTAGSGRIPAAFNNLIGLKPTRGWIPTRGVVPACASLDCVSVFALNMQEAWAALTAMAGFDPEDPWSRHSETPCLPTGPLCIGVPSPAELLHVDPSWLTGHQRVLDVIRSLGHHIVTIDYSAFREAAASLYGGAWVAERTAAVGEVLDRAPVGADPTVSRIVRAGRSHDAVAAFRSIYRVAALHRQSELQWARCDVLCLPTAPFHPTLAAVAADPVGVNAQLGCFTNFANLLDTCAAAVPSGFTVGGLPTGVTLFAPAWHDLLTARLGAAIQDALALPMGAMGERLRGPQVIAGDDGGAEIAVFGAHLTGQPLNRELLAAGGRLVREIRTAPAYRLFALPTTPPKPGLLRDGTGSIAGELWRLPYAGFGSFVASIPAPLGIGTVPLDDGRSVKGFVAESIACIGAEDITAWGSWPAWRARS